MIEKYHSDIKKFYKNTFQQLITRDWFLLWCKLTVNPRGSNFFNRKGGKFSRGAAVTLTLSTLCNFRCRYCPLMHEREEYPEWNMCSMDEWKELITEFPEWLSLVLISGGEPTLIRWLPEFVNWLLDSGRKVCIFTNLAVPIRFKDIKKSSRLQIQATYHHEDSPERFTNAYKKVTGYGHKVDATEIGNEEKVLDFTHYKPYITTEVEKVYARQFHCAPNAPRTRAVYMGPEQYYENSL